MNTIPSELDKYNASRKVCPKDGCTAGGVPQDIETMFGWRVVSGKKTAQSYCTNCRKGKKQLGLFPSPGDKAKKLVDMTDSEIDQALTDIKRGEPIEPEGENMATERLEAIGFQTAQHDPGHSFKVIEQFARQKLGMFEHAITPNHAVTILHLVTGNGSRFHDDNDNTDSKFSMIVRAEASLRTIPTFLPWEMPEWSTYGGFNRFEHKSNGDAACTDERRMANAMLRWGLALVAWCDEEQPRREDIEARMKKKEEAEKAKKAAAKAKQKAKGGKAKARSVNPDPSDDDYYENEEDNE